MAEATIRIDAPANRLNHPAGAWWDDYVGWTFSPIALHDGVPRQWEVDTSRIRLGYRSAFVPESYVTVDY